MQRRFDVTLTLLLRHVSAGLVYIHYIWKLKLDWVYICVSTVWHHYYNVMPLIQCWLVIWALNTLRPRQYGHRFADDTFMRIFLNENVRISIKVSLKFVPKGPINNIPALVQIMAWRRSGDKPLSEPMMVSLLTHICVTRPQWVKNKKQWLWFGSISMRLKCCLQCVRNSRMWSKSYNAGHVKYFLNVVNVHSDDFLLSIDYSW